MRAIPVLLAICTFLPAPLCAQQFEMPVRRAQPVQSETPAPANEPPAPPAVPFDFDKPAPRPSPVPRAEPVFRPSATPTPAAAESPAKDEIRVAPNVGQTMDKAQINLANGLYARKMYELAAPEYERYLGLYGNGADRQTALFRLGECYNKMGNTNAAKNSYSMLLSTFTEGDFVGAAAYRLADLFYQEKDYDDAAPYFRQASVRDKDPAVVNAAKFYGARSLENLHQNSEAIDIYSDLLQTKGNNPFRDYARFSLAQLLLDAGRRNDALQQLEIIAQETGKNSMKAEATVKAALIETDLGHYDKAAAGLKKAMSMPDAGKLKAVAAFGLLRIDYNAGKKKEFLDTYTKTLADLSAEDKPEAMLLAANMYRQAGDQAAARKACEEIIASAPDSPAAKEARYTRLLTLYSTDDPDLIHEVNAYLTANPSSDKTDQLALLKAEYFFKKKDFAQAAPLYQGLDESAISEAFKADAEFKLGWCYMKTGETDKAIKAFSIFITEYPNDKLIPKALAQRAMAYERKPDLAAALKDCEEIAASYPKTVEGEFALEQKATILGKQDDNKGMADAFRQLLSDYPKTPAAATANYCIGWASYENKDYKGAIEPLETARKLDKEQFFEKASFRIMLSYYNLGDQRAALAKEVDIYTTGGGKGKVPAEILRWLGADFFKANDFANAAKYLAELTARGAQEATPADWLLLGNALLRQEKYSEAAEAFGSYLKVAGGEAVPQATGLLALGQAQLGLKQYDEARKTAESALSLQPEGTLNAKGRLLSGDIEMGSGHYDNAVRVFLSVSLIFSDDPEITPMAMEKAYEALKKAGKDAEAQKVLNNLQSRYPEYQLKTKTVSAPL